MPSAFNFSASPFDCLSPQERDLVRANVDIAYFPAGATILEVGSVPTHLYVVIKGYVAQRDDGEDVGVYGPEDSFDGRGLVAGRVSSRFVAMEEVVAYQLTRNAVNSLISGNATFSALLFEGFSKKLTALSERRSRHEAHTLSMARVNQAFLRPPVFVDAHTDVRSVAAIFNQMRVNNVLVRDATAEPPRLGMFTLGSLSRAILDDTPLDRLPVGSLAHWRLISVSPDDHLYDALALMIRHRVTRVVVLEGSEVRGLLEQVDLLSFMANSSSLIMQRILQSETLEQLKRAAGEITDLVALLHRSGTRVGMIARLVQELNASLFDKAWSLIASHELQAGSCLFVMGSEGRGEQLLKTDQDNGLILRDDIDVPSDEIARSCERFSRALVDFGYPECPGGIMLSNPAWRMSASDFSRTAQGWLTEPTPERLMSLAIFIDAHPVSGDASLLDQVRQDVYALVNGNQFLMTRFAAAVEFFSSAPGWWNRILALGDDGTEQINLKKAGIFAIVHGLRSMALEARISATGSSERIAALVEAGVLAKEMGDELLESLHFLMGLRLKVGLAEIETNREVSGEVDMRRLSSLERDLLKDALAVVKRFKALLKQRFRLDLA
jgi:CBS domain-containing protein